MIADSVEYLTANGRRVLVDMEHFFDGYKSCPEFSLRALEAAVVKGATHVVLCDTNGGSLPHEIEAIVADVYRHVGSDVMIGIHCHDDTGCAVANSMAAVRAGARHVQGHVERPRRAHGERQPHDDHPQPAAQTRAPVPSRGPARAAHRRQPPHRRDAEPCRRPAGAVRRVVGVRPQGRTPRQRHRPRQGRLRARRPDTRRQRHAVRGERDGGTGDDPDEGRRAGPDDGRSGGQPGDRRPQAARARGLPLRGRRRLARAADAPGDRMGPGVLPGREHASDHRRDARRATSTPRRPSRCGSAISATSSRPKATGP